MKVIFITTVFILMLIVAFAIYFRFHPKIKYMSPDDVLYSLPTISSDWGESETVKSLKNLYVIHEDDWRQKEFVSDKFTTEIEQENEAINNIYENYRDEVGFKELHVREKILRPLEGKHIQLDEIKRSLEIAREYNGVAYTHKQLVKSSFAFEVKDIGVFWGQIDEHNDILCLCIMLSEERNNLQDLLNGFLAKHGLYYVDWCRMNVIKAE